MTDTPDRQRDELLLAVEHLNDLAALLKWLEPEVRGSMSNEWHIVSAATWVALDRRRAVERELAELDRARDGFSRLAGDDA